MADGLHSGASFCEQKRRSGAGRDRGTTDVLTGRRSRLVGPSADAPNGETQLDDGLDEVHRARTVVLCSQHCGDLLEVAGPHRNWRVRSEFVSMTFPVPAVYASEAADMARDDTKRLKSPPSFFFARARGLELAAGYFTDERVQGSAAVAAKHRQRVQSALFGQVMAAFEWCIKDFVAQTIDATDLLDETVQDCKWIEIDRSRVLAQRETATSPGALLVHPTGGWHDGREVNKRYSILFQASPIDNAEMHTLDRLWLLRHSIAHNGGLVTHHDAYRMGEMDLAGKTVRIDEDYIAKSIETLAKIIGRLGSVVGDKLLERWMKDRSTGVFAVDNSAYEKLKLLTTVERSRSANLPPVLAADYTADRNRFGL